MNKIIRLIFVFSLMFFIGCEGERGLTGPQGQNGEDDIDEANDDGELPLLNNATKTSLNAWLF